MSSVNLYRVEVIKKKKRAEAAEPYRPYQYFLFFIECNVHFFSAKSHAQVNWSGLSWKLEVLAVSL